MSELSVDISVPVQGAGGPHETLVKDVRFPVLPEVGSHVEIDIDGGEPMVVLVMRVDWFVTDEAGFPMVKATVLRCRRIS